MDIAQLVRLALHASIFLVVLALGLRTSLSDATYLARERGLLLRSILAMNVAMPIIVAVIALSFDLHPAVKIALIALAVSPVPPFLPGKQLKFVSTGGEAYVYALLVSSSVLAIVIVPLTIGLLAAALSRDVAVAPAAVARTVAFTVLLPLGVGMALRHSFPATERLSSIAGTAGTIMLVLLLVLLLLRSWPAMIELIGNGTLVAIVAVALLGLAVGHLLGGPGEDERTVLALATTSRHPAVAMAVAGVGDQALAPAAIVLALIVGAVVAVPYTAWRKRLRIEARMPHAGPGSR